MIIVRRSEERRHIGTEVQKTWMTFDRENKADPLQNGFGSLRLLNEELLTSGTGFILHTPKNLIVLTYVREGLIISNDHLEEPALVAHGEFHMAATGAGTRRDTYGVSEPESSHFFQSGFTQGSKAGTGVGAKKLFTQAERKGVLKLVASPDGRDSSLTILQDVLIYSSYVFSGNHMIHELSEGRKAWLHLVSGQILLNDLLLHTGDGAGFSDERSVSFTAQCPVEILLFDMA